MAEIYPKEPQKSGEGTSGMPWLSLLWSVSLEGNTHKLPRARVGSCKDAPSCTAGIAMQDPSWGSQPVGRRAGLLDCSQVSSKSPEVETLGLPQAKRNCH